MIKTLQKYYSFQNPLVFLLVTNLFVSFHLPVAQANFFKKISNFKKKKTSDCSKVNGISKLNYIGQTSKHPGPEDIAFDQNGNMFFGTQDGSIYSIDAETNYTKLIINTKGRPLGLGFLDEKNLIIADAHKGLLEYNFEKDQLTKLVSSYNDVPFLLTDDLIISSEGIVYFTDASSKFSVDQSLLEVILTEPNGRLFSYDPETRETHLLLDNLFFPNGLALSPHEDFLLLNESTKDRILRVWINGNEVVDTEVFLDNLPGFPDNINLSENKDGYWVAFAGKRVEMLKDQKIPKGLKKVISRTPSSITSKLLPKADGHIIKINLMGEIEKEINFGKCFRSTTSVMEYNGMIYIGSFTEDFPGVVSLP